MKHENIQIPFHIPEVMLLYTHLECVHSKYLFTCPLFQK